MKVAYFVMRYPWRSQTFIAREMRGVAGHGIAVEVHPVWDWRLRPPAAPPEDHAAGMILVRCSPWQILLRAPAAVARELRRDRTLLRRGWRLLRAHRPRTFEGWLHTVWGALFACVRAEYFRRCPEAAQQHFHGAWATAPATVAGTLGALTGRPWSFGAHAYDLHRRGGDPLLAPKLAAAAFVHTSTQTNAGYLETRFPDRRAPIILARRGLEELPPPAGLSLPPVTSPLQSSSSSAPTPTSVTPQPAPAPTSLPKSALTQTPASASDSASAPTPTSAPAPATPPRKNLDPAEGPHLLSVGRLVEKKGHFHQLAACRELRRRGRPFRLRIIGDGPLRPALERAIREAGLGEQVELLGALDSPAVERAYASWAHIFWHTGIVDHAGDVDGLPNVIPEALAHALPVISGSAGATTEAIRDGETGLLVDPADPAALADAVERLTADPALRARLGRAGRAWVEEHFLAEKNTRRLAEAFRATTNAGQLAAAPWVKATSPV